MSEASRRDRKLIVGPGRQASATDQMVGARLKQRRRLLGISQKELAEKLELAIQQLQKYETGRNRISASRLYQISQILGVPIDWFFSEEASRFGTRSSEGEKSSSEKPANKNLNEQLAILSVSFLRIRTIDDRQRVIKFANSLKARGRKRLRD